MRLQWRQEIWKVQLNRLKTYCTNYSYPKLNAPSLIRLRLPLYAKNRYEWDVVDARSVAETDSSVITYYFYAMEKGKELNLERLADMGLYVRDGFVSRVSHILFGFGTNFGSAVVFH